MKYLDNLKLAITAAINVSDEIIKIYKSDEFWCRD